MIEWDICLAAIGIGLECLRLSIDFIAAASQSSAYGNDNKNNNKNNSTNASTNSLTEPLLSNQQDDEEEQVNEEEGEEQVNVWQFRIKIILWFTFIFQWIMISYSIVLIVLSSVGKNKENNSSQSLSLFILFLIYFVLSQIFWLRAMFIPSTSSTKQQVKVDNVVPGSNNNNNKVQPQQEKQKEELPYRKGPFQNSLYMLASLFIMIATIIFFSTNKRQYYLYLLYPLPFTFYHWWTMAQVQLIKYCYKQQRQLNDENNNDGAIQSRKRKLSWRAIAILLQPYFWPSSTTSSATWNRIRALGTWVCVLLSKVANIVSPLLLGRASTYLVQQDYTKTITFAVLYCTTSFLGAALKEGQSLVYLRVAQAAFCQLSSTTFLHLHSLSFDWHVQKKLGEVLRSMDRGILACDTLMKYLFLWLVPALAEAFVVCLLFGTYFQYWPLGLSVFSFVWVYIVWTIWVTLWRKKYRKAVVQSDNEWHDLCTDSMVNFETVKYFTAEQFELERFSKAIERYQVGSVSVNASLSFLNITQKLLLQACLAVALSLTARSIHLRWSCCENTGHCNYGDSVCCDALSDQCRGMQVGDFVAVLTYTIQLFTPLNFLGSLYNAVVMAIIDLTSLSELLAEYPDVTDAPDAKDLIIPTLSSNNDNDVATREDNGGNEEQDDDVAVEFDNVIFHYPSQPPNTGLKGLSFRMKRGTTTAIVGPTGAGKTTVSRLLFRFYDVKAGAVKIFGQDVQTITQTSLRKSVGIVPQSASMFNDTLRANVLYGRPSATQDELDEAARQAQLMPLVESLEDGWETLVGDRGLKLSGGELQRTAIARCLLKNPPLVVLDEATSALDTITEASVQQALDQLGRERTVLVIAHRLGTIRKADNIIVLKNGVVHEEGTHQELLAIENGQYAEMWNMQLHEHDNNGNSSSRDLLSDPNIS